MSEGVAQRPVFEAYSKWRLDTKRAPMTAIYYLEGQLKWVELQIQMEPLVGVSDWAV